MRQPSVGTVDVWSIVSECLTRWILLIHILLSVPRKQFSKVFCNNSKAFLSELIENLEEILQT